MITNTNNVGILSNKTYSVTYVQGQKYSVTLTQGRYLIECWGAGGSHDTIKEGGNGAYVRGNIRIIRKTTLYLFAGESGKTYGDVTYNGGGSGLFIPDPDPLYNDFWLSIKGKAKCGSGGGATDVRLVDGEWNSFESLKSRIMVAAGGGGYVNFNNGAGDNEVSGSSGGALEAKNGSYSQCINCSDDDAGAIDLAEGGTQTSGGKTPSSEGGFGYGGNSYFTIGGGGGGGYFGGSGGSCSTHRNGSGAGGSSFISGHNGCIAFPESSLTNIHYSGLYFTDTEMKSGDEIFLSPDGEFEKGHIGDGYIRITAISNLTHTKNIQMSFPLRYYLFF